jgi:hypothetical protein
VTDSGEVDRLIVEGIEQAVAFIDPDAGSSLPVVVARARRIRRRRAAVRVGAPVVLAAAAVAAVLALVDRSPQGREVVVPTTSSPTPPAATSVVGHWGHHVAANAGAGNLESVWVVRIDSPDAGTIQIKPRARFGAGTLRLQAGRQVWVVDVLGSYCGGRTGTYRLELLGDALTFTHVVDPCQARVNILEGTLFERATPEEETPG